MASGVLTRAPDAILAASNVAVRRALELAGGKLLTRDMRGRFPDTPKFEMHTKVRIPAAQTADLLTGAFDYLALDMAGIDVNITHLANVLDEYCRVRIHSARPHDVLDLDDFLRQRSVIRE